MTALQRIAKARELVAMATIGIASPLALVGCAEIRTLGHVLDDENEEHPAVAPLFSESTEIPLRLEFPFTSLFENRDSLDVVYLQASLIHDSVEIPVLVRTRGRTSLASCRFPKLQMKFDKDNAEGIEKDQTFLRQARAIKIGTHCDHIDPGPNQTGTEYAVKREQLAYQLYSVGDKPAFRTRSARIVYINTDQNNESIGTKEAFLLENIKDVAERHSFEEFEFSDDQEGHLENIDVWRSRLDQKATVNVILSHIMLFTTDWNIMGYNRHHNASIRNTKFLDSSSGLIPVPYDFDLTFAINDNMQEIIDILSTMISEVPDNFRANEPDLVRSQLWLIKEQERHFPKEMIVAELNQIRNHREMLLSTIETANVSDLVKSNYLMLVKSFFEASSIYESD